VCCRYRGGGGDLRLKYRKGGGEQQTIIGGVLKLCTSQTLQAKKRIKQRKTYDNNQPRIFLH